MSRNATDVVHQSLVVQHGELLGESVSLATPLTITAVAGRERATNIMRELTSALGLNRSEFVTETEQGAIATFTGTVDGHDVGLLSLLTDRYDGGYRRVDLFARPWPFVGMARAKLIIEDDLFGSDIGLSTPYVPSGPWDSYLRTPPSLPALADDVAFHSPILTATATGRDLITTILEAVEASYGTPRFRAVIPAGDNVVIAFYDGLVHGHVIQIAAVFTMNSANEIADMRIYSRPWPVTALFRGEVYKLLRTTLGDEFWQGVHPLAALGEAATNADA